MWTPRWGPQTTAWWRQANTNNNNPPTNPAPAFNHPLGGANNNSASASAAAIGTNHDAPTDIAPQPTVVAPGLATGGAGHAMCAGCVAHDAVRSERIYALCRHNQKRLDTNGQQMEELQLQIRLLNETVAKLAAALAKSHSEPKPPKLEVLSSADRKVGATAANPDQTRDEKSPPAVKLAVERAGSTARMGVEVARSTQCGATAPVDIRGAVAADSRPKAGGAAGGGGAGDEATSTGSPFLLVDDGLEYFCKAT